jgi:hypothetical protein
MKPIFKKVSKTEQVTTFENLFDFPIATLSNELLFEKEKELDLFSLLEDIRQTNSNNYL